MTFRQMVGYEDYEVSDSGIIRNRKTGTIRKQRDNSNGYATVRIKVGGKQKLIFAHRAVAEAFIPNPFGKECVNHKDGDKKNNNVANLEWVAHRENTEHAAKTLKKLNQYQRANAASERRVICTTQNKEKEYPSIAVAAREVGIEKPNIISALKGRTKTSGGMTWRYAE